MGRFYENGLRILAVDYFHKTLYSAIVSSALTCISNFRRPFRFYIWAVAVIEQWLGGCHN